MTNTETAGQGTQAAGPAAPDSSVFPDVICAVDGTRSSAAAVEVAAALAGSAGHLTLLAVTAVSGSGAYTTAAISPARVDLVLQKAASIAEQGGVPSSKLVDPEGPPVEVILQRASGHDLLAIGAPATSWLAGVLTGGVAAAALSEFTTPMLFARRSATPSLKGRTILVASDGEEGSDHLVDLAVRLGRSQGSRVTLVNVPGAESRTNARAIEAQVQKVKGAGADGGEPRIEPGKAHEVIVEAAKETDAALIVMGSRRLHGLHAFGSVSRHVVHEAPCSVLVIPPRPN